MKTQVTIRSCRLGSSLLIAVARINEETQPVPGARSLSDLLPSNVPEPHMPTYSSLVARLLHSVCLGNATISERHKKQFLDYVDETVRDDMTVDAQEVTRAVFRTISKHVSGGEIAGIKHTLPREIRELWT